MDGERSASENLAERAFFGSSQNLAISKPRLTKYDFREIQGSRTEDGVRGRPSLPLHPSADTALGS